MTRLGDRSAVFTDHDFAEADRLDRLLGVSEVEEERRRELLKVVHCLAGADRTVEDVRNAMLGPYGGLVRLKYFTHRSAKAVARVHALNEVLHAKFDQVLALPGGARAAAVLEGRSRLQLDIEAELVASLSPERRAVVESLRRSSARASSSNQRS